MDEYVRQAMIDNLMEERGQPQVVYEPPAEGMKMRLVAAIPFIGMTGSDIAVLCSLALHANAKTGRCNPSEKRIARKTRKPLRTVGRSISRLIEAGYITVLRRGHIAQGSNCYQVQWRKLDDVRRAYDWDPKEACREHAASMKTKSGR